MHAEDSPYHHGLTRLRACRVGYKLSPTRAAQAQYERLIDNNNAYINVYAVRATSHVCKRTAPTPATGQHPRGTVGQSQLGSRTHAHRHPARRHTAGERAPHAQHDIPHERPSAQIHRDRHTLTGHTTPQAVSSSSRKIAASRSTPRTRTSAVPTKVRWRARYPGATHRIPPLP